MTRPSRDNVLMEIAGVMARRSSCKRRRVGVVIARDGRILSTGYNGAPAGMEHCSHECDCGARPEEFHARVCFSQQPCHVSIHAEANALAYAARYGVSLEGGDLYTTLLPCVPCAQLIVAAGITRVRYAQDYRDPAGGDYLRKAEVDLQMLVAI